MEEIIKISSKEEFVKYSHPGLICSGEFDIIEANESFKKLFFIPENNSKLNDIVELVDSDKNINEYLLMKHITVQKAIIRGDERAFYRFERLGHSIDSADQVICIKDVTDEVIKNNTIYKKFFDLANSLPIPIIVSDFEKNLFINNEGYELVEKIFDSIDIFKSQVYNFSGLYKKIFELNDVSRHYKYVRETGNSVKNIFTPIKEQDREEVVLLSNISLVTDLNDQPVGYLTTFENITEVFNFNRELHYSLMNLKGVIEAFARDRIAYLLAYGEEETVKHLLEVRYFSELIAETILTDTTIPNKEILEYSKINPIYIRMLGLAALLHDFGKVEPHIYKLIAEPRRLSSEEYEQVKGHAKLGADFIGYDNEMLRMCWLVALYHHEKYDGSGYPEGLKGREIPLSARIVAFADMYSALKSKRPYKDAMKNTNEILNIIQQNESSFDPVVFRIGMKLVPEMEKKSEFLEKEYKNFEMTAEDAIKLITDVFNAIKSRK